MGGSLDVLTGLWAGRPRDGLIAVRAKKCFFSIISTSALGPFRLPVYWVTSTLSSGLKGRWPRVDSRISCSVEVKNAWSYKSTPSTCIYGVLLNYAEGRLYLLFSVVVWGGGAGHSAATLRRHNLGTVTWILVRGLEL